MKIDLTASAPAGAVEEGAELPGFDGCSIPLMGRAGGYWRACCGKRYRLAMQRRRSPAMRRG